VKRLAIASIVAGVFVGQTFNGSTTQTIGVYLIVLAALLFVCGVAPLPGPGDES
jgi:hypothetical protein